MTALALTLALLAASPDDFDAIVRDVGRVQPLVLASRMEAWAQASPGDARVGQALLWAAQQRLRELDREGARRTLERLVETTPSSPAVPDAQLVLADLEVETHDFTQALARYDLVQTAGDERLRYLAAEHRREALSARVRFVVSWVVGGLLALIAAARLRRARAGRTLWPLPEEAWRALPVALLLAVAAFGQPAQERQAVLTVCALGFALTWVTGAAWTARAPRGNWRFAEALLAVAQAGGVLFLAIESSRLWSRVVDTFAQGAQ
jgi:hypothetical protein